MKRFLLFLAALLFFVSLTKAQQFRVGLLAGGNISDVDGFNSYGHNTFRKAGFTFGGLVSTHISAKTIIEMEIAYSQLGSSNPPDSTNNNNYYTLRLNYINVDIAIRHHVLINFSKKPNSNFSIECGASLGYMYRDYYTAQSIILTPYIDLSTTTIAAFAGFSYNFSPDVCLDLRYYNSILSDFPNTPSNSQFLYYGSFNRGHNLNFQITFKVTFGSDSPAIVAAEGSAPPSIN